MGPPGLFHVTEKNTPVIESNQQSSAILSLPPESLRLDIDTIERLHKLGLKQIKDFIAMPRPSLRRRFGRQLIQRINQALGYEEEIIQPVQPPEPYHERLPCLEPIVTAAGLKLLYNDCWIACVTGLKTKVKVFAPLF